MATWSEPFTLEGEELSYVITITDTASGVQDEVAINTTRYVLSELRREGVCAEFQFTVVSKNDYSISMTNVSEWKNIPIGTVIMQRNNMKYVNMVISLFFLDHRLTKHAHLRHTHTHALNTLTYFHTVPLVMKRSDVWINVFLMEEIQVMIAFNVSSNNIFVIL